jgi:hypothetical protein
MHISSDDSRIFRSNKFACILVVLAVVFLIRGTNFHINGDGLVRFQGIVSLMQKEEIPKIKYSMISSIFSIPFYLIKAEYVKYFNISVFFTSMLLITSILRKHFGSNPAIKFLIICLVGSMFTRYIQDFWAEVFSASFLFLGILYFILEKKKYLAALLISLAAANTPALMVPLAMLIFYWIYEDRNVRYLTILIVPFTLILTETFIKYGSILNTGYENDHGFKTLLPYSGLPGFSYPMILGILSILFSFGKGLLFFTPGLFLIELKNKNKDLQRLFISLFTVTVGLILIYAKWWAWYGGICWGPRFFLFVSIVASLVLAFQLSEPTEGKSTLRLLLISSVAAMSLYVGFMGHVTDDAWAAPAIANNYALESFNWYVPEFSVLIYPLIFQKIFTGKNLVFLTFILLVYGYITADLWSCLFKRVCRLYPDK